jgi:hypothetical protein
MAMPIIYVEWGNFARFYFSEHASATCLLKENDSLKKGLDLVSISFFG